MDERNLFSRFVLTKLKINNFQEYFMLTVEDRAAVANFPPAHSPWIYLTASAIAFLFMVPLIESHFLIQFMSCSRKDGAEMILLVFSAWQHLLSGNTCFHWL